MRPYQLCVISNHRLIQKKAEMLLLAAIVLGEQAPATPSPGSGVDRPALPKGSPSLGLEWDVILSVGIDESRSPRPAAPAAGAAAAAPPVIGAPGLAPGQMAPESAEAAPAAPMVVDPAQMPEPTTAELGARKRRAASPRGRAQAERDAAGRCRRRRQGVPGGDQSAERPVGWRRQQKEHDAQTEARDAELRELRHMLAECEEMLDLARVMLLSLLERSWCSSGHMAPAFASGQIAHRSRACKLGFG